jgi:tetratricopeptide (TPR) repeat protein
VVYNLMSFRQRRRLHRAFALWLEERYASDLSPHLPLLAHHWKQTEEEEKALHYLERAGEQALNNYANAEALRFLGDAAELADAHPGSVEDDRRSRWEYWRGIALIKLARYDESDECFRRGLGLIGHGLPSTRLGMGLDLAGQILRQVGHRLLPAIFTRKRRHREALRHAATIHQHHAECFYFHQDVLGLVHASFRTLNDAERAGDADDVARAYATIAIVAQIAGLHRLAYWYSDRSLGLLGEMEALPEIAYVNMLALVSRLPMDSETYQER